MRNECLAGNRGSSRQQLSVTLTISLLDFLHVGNSQVGLRVQAVMGRSVSLLSASAALEG